MTHIARRDRDFFTHCAGRIDRRGVVTARAFEIGVTRKFVPKRRRRIAPPPREERDLIVDLHRRGKARVEIRFR